LISLARYFRTLRYIKPVQVYYRVRYSVLPGRRRIRNPKRYPVNIYHGNFSVSPPFLSQITYNGNNTFLFLNLEKEFKESVDWNFNGYGKLWNYNLNYFEYLHQPGLNSDDGAVLIRDYCRNLPEISNGLKPYPLSLRCFNWIKFLINHQIRDDDIDRCLWQQLTHLKNKLEYHLLANHILENGFALLYGSLYFNDANLYTIAEKIVKKELCEQILPDGGHFELSPMYHQILLGRLLDCINLMHSCEHSSKEFLQLMRETAERMLAWLQNISFKNGEIPLLNDAARGIAPATESLIKYAKRLNNREIKIDLGESGYRKYQNSKFECILDVGRIGPDYQPAHSHADTFTFELYINKKPFIVDSGTSTYEPGERRAIERGTAAHNTVVCHNENSSEVWSSHRVGRRAYVTIEEEKPEYIRASHNGYRHKRTLHTRSFEFDHDKMIVMDSIKGIDSSGNQEAFLHFHPDIELHIDGSNLKSNMQTGIQFEGAEKISMIPYKYAPEFNTLIPAQCVRIIFRGYLTTIIEF
jgi:hypothetical protein